MSKIISLFNQSGGVAKTTLTHNLGYHLSQLEQKVLLVDMDPQASLTLFCGLEPFDLQQTIYESLLLEQPLPVVAIAEQGLNLIPANIQLSAAEIELVNVDLRDFRLKDALSPVSSDYDYILIDCPPSLGILSYISLVASTHILVPIATQYKAWMGTELLLKTVARVQGRANPNLTLIGFVPTLYASRNSQDTRALSAIREQLNQVGIIFPPIPRSTAFADASEANIPLSMYQPSHPGVKAIKSLAKQLIKKI